MFGRREKAERPEPFPTDHAGDELQNRALVDAMRAVSVDDTAATRAVLFQLLLDSHLVVLSPSEPAEHRTWTAEKGDTLQLVTFSDDEGTVLPVFTSVDALLRFRPDGGGYVALPASALFQMADAGGTGRLRSIPGRQPAGTSHVAKLRRWAGVGCLSAGPKSSQRKRRFALDGPPNHLHSTYSMLSVHH